MWTLAAGALSEVRKGSRHEGGELRKMDSEPNTKILQGWGSVCCFHWARLLLPFGIYPGS